jgi:hypothetical protein
MKTKIQQTQDEIEKQYEVNKNEKDNIDND